MKEWTDPFNSFNSLKGLLYRKWMEGIIAGDFLPPVEASIDPVFNCNLDCIWCNSQNILKNPDINVHIMSREHLINLCRFLAEWGVKGLCFAGGGEPFMHPDLAEVTEMLGEMGADTAFLTNGTLIKDRDIEAMVKYSRWIGVSIDTGNRENYAVIKKTKPELFDEAVENLRKMVEMRNRMGSNFEISYKYLIYPDNAPFIYEAVKLAKDIGVDYVHIRPAAAENVLGSTDFHLQFPLDSINEQMQKSFELEDENFRVFGIRHKFSPSMNLKRNFTRCLAPPLLINCGPDGHVYLCVDHRGKKQFSIGKHYPDPENILTFWGGEKHRNMMKNVNLDVCPRCTFGVYNEIIEKTIIEDRMCRNFP
ncbi:MAG: radical SAM protein [Candidatus Eremiobacteraeota bacterium]|nr:radical SAM protein [Candidatus Eremiobacteraeota bacterium]